MADTNLFRSSIARRCRPAAPFAIIAALALLLAACGSSSTSSASKHSGWPSTLVVGEVGQENSAALTSSLAPITNLVKKQLGVDLKVVTGTSYSSMIEAQKTGKAQIVLYGPFSWFIAKNKQKLNASLLAIPITAPGTNGSYYSQAVVNPTVSPDITSLNQAKGKSVCFSDPASTSGFLIPSYGLLQVGIDPQKDVKGTFAGSDSTTAIDVSKGQCQIGFTNTVNLPQAEQTHSVDPAKVKVIWQSQQIPASPLAISNSVPASLRTALGKLLINQANSPWLTDHGYCTSVSQCTTTTTQWGYAPPSVANYSLIGTVCKVTKSPACNG